MFICGAKPEYDDVYSKYGYSSREVVYTGLARYDLYHNLNPKKQILIMPTWRRGLGEQNIIESDYYKTWSEVINSKEIDMLLEGYGFKAFFYVHPQFQKFSNLFHTDLKNVVVAVLLASYLRSLLFLWLLLQVVTNFSLLLLWA